MRTALRQPPQTQPVSSDEQVGPREPAQRRPVAEGDGRGPRCAAAGHVEPGHEARAARRRRRPWSRTPSCRRRVQKRSRVSALTITRSRAWPPSESSHRAGSLPYISCRNSPDAEPRSTDSTSAASTSVSRHAPLRQHAGMHHQHAAADERCSAIGCWRSQSSSASRSGASSTPCSVSLAAAACARPAPRRAGAGRGCRAGSAPRRRALHAPQHRGRCGAAVDQVAQQHQVVAAGREGDLVEQALQGVVAALHVADQVECHASPFSPASMDVFLLALLTLLNALFAMSEMALSTSRRARLAALAEAGDAGARGRAQAAGGPDAVPVHGADRHHLDRHAQRHRRRGRVRGAARRSGWRRLGMGPGAASVVSTAMVVTCITFFTIIFGELVPKRIGQLYPEPVARYVARPMRWLATARQALRAAAVGRHGRRRSSCCASIRTRPARDRGRDRRQPGGGRRRRRDRACTSTRWCATCSTSTTGS